MATKKKPAQKAAVKKKSRKMEPKLVSKQKHEIKYEAKKLKTSQKKIREAKAKVGRSRKKIEAEIAGSKD